MTTRSAPVTALPEIEASSFTQVFHALHDQPPFRWQVRLAERACQGEWPRFIKLPTSSGKTSCLDIAIFALAFQAWRRHGTRQIIDAPRRIFFVVDRRIVVNEAYQRAQRIKSRLDQAVARPADPLHPVAWWLRSLAGQDSAPPLDCFELRGGVYRDDAWVRSLLQPTIITSTVDQVGSRLLFRGYGVSDANLPIHAALTANDSLILLDEAHCSNPFCQTMAAIASYRDAGAPSDGGRWAENPLATPFRFVEMTATPRAADGADVFQLEAADYRTDRALEQRHGCAKPIRLHLSNAKGAKQNVLLAKHLVEQANSLAHGADGPACMRVAIVVNRVDCARRAFELLKQEHGERVELMIGRMRPIDRERLTQKLQHRFQSGSAATLAEPHFVVATQCLEVGADFDFDGMVCQCASLDALRQRFGRLNRLGQSLHARGVVVMADGDQAPRKPDPIYGASLPAAWEWLLQASTANVVDFGVRALDALLARQRADGAAGIELLRAPMIDAPVLMPAHLDLLCQTSPRPALEPDIAAFLHGPGRGVPEVRICWRADLPEQMDENCDDWLEACEQTLAVCPPASAECLSIPWPQFKAWLQGDVDAPSIDPGDLLGEAADDEDEAPRKSLGMRIDTARRRGILWNGRRCTAISGDRDEPTALVSQSLIVLPASAGGWSSLGYVPDAPPDPSISAAPAGRSNSSDELLQKKERQSLAQIDEASAAFRQARDRCVLRVHRKLATSDADNDALHGLWEFVDDLSLAWIHQALAIDDEPVAVASPAPEQDDRHCDRAAQLQDARRLLATQARQTKFLRYPGGFVVIGPRLSRRAALPRASFDDDFDEHNCDADRRVTLADHLADVTAETQRLVGLLNMDEAFAKPLVAAAERHDLGKADLRFQAMLLGSSLDVAAMQPKLWAKSDRGAASRSTARSVSSRGGAADSLPRGFRHEMASLELAPLLHDDLDAQSRELMLHVIAAHHGHARPFAPVVFDDAPPELELDKLDSSVTRDLKVRRSSDERRRLPVHRLDSDVAERFWKFTRRFGWWGLAWLESSLRLADWAASAQPSSQAPALRLRPRTVQAPLVVDKHEIPLIGLDATNVLAYLAALGMLRTVTSALPTTSVRMQWRSTERWHPVLILDQKLSERELAEVVSAALRDRQHDEHFNRLGKNINVDRLEFRQALLEAMNVADRKQRTTIDFYAAFGSDGLVSQNDHATIQDSALRTMAGAGHQHFLETMRNLIVKCQLDHLEKTLFRAWTYDDPTQTLSLRYDPADDVRYALRWRNPSGDPARKTSGSMIGANRLAIEAIPLFSTAPDSRRLQTTAFTGFRSHDTFLYLPIWDAPLQLSTIRSLLASREVLAQPPQSDELRRRGIAAVVLSQRITVGKVRNFSRGRVLWGTL